jgi:hypothetical protein
MAGPGCRKMRRQSLNVLLKTLPNLVFYIYFFFCSKEIEENELEKRIDNKSD